MTTNYNSNSDQPSLLPMDSSSSSTPSQDSQPHGQPPTKKRRIAITNDQRLALRRFASDPNYTKPTQQQCIIWFTQQFNHPISQSTVSDTLSVDYAYLDDGNIDPGKARVPRNARGASPFTDLPMTDIQARLSTPRPPKEKLPAAAGVPSLDSPSKAGRALGTYSAFKKKFDADMKKLQALLELDDVRFNAYLEAAVHARMAK